MIFLKKPERKIPMLILLIFFYFLPVKLLSDGSYSALEIPYHVRSLSMSAVGVADWQGMDMSASNPALLSDKQSLILSLVRYPANIQSSMLEWRQNLKGRNVAFTFRHIGYGSFVGRDDEGIETGKFSAGDTWGSFSMSQRLFSLVNIGMTGGLLFSQIENVDAIVAVFTAGAVLKLPKYESQIGFAIRNLGYTINSYTKNDAPIPLSLNIGVSKKLAHLPLMISLDGVWWKTEDRGVVRIGGEFILPGNLFLRLGTTSYRFNLDNDILWQSYITGSSIGIGYGTKKLAMDLGVNYYAVGGIVVGVGFSTSL